MSDGMRLRSGVHLPLEAAADEILRKALSGITKHSEKSDVLTPWKEADRRKREVYVSTGTPDGSVRKGNFHRVANTQHGHLNSVEAMQPPKLDRSHGPSAWDNE